MQGDQTHRDHLDASEESSRTEIGLAKAEGLAYGAALKYLIDMEASDSGSRGVGDYTVGYVIEEAEGLYYLRDGDLEWTEPTDYNCHIEVVVRSAADGRFLPGLTIGAELLNPGGASIANIALPFLWHPWIYHYGANCTVPSPGKYKLRIHIAVPDFPRHDRVNGKRFFHPTDLEFEVKIMTGRKLTSAA
jgi:uncharacterized protein involved in high-affinity Fe2+ transport